MKLSIAKRILTVFLLSLFVLLLGAACGGEEEAAAGGRGWRPSCSRR